MNRIKISPRKIVSRCRIVEHVQDLIITGIYFYVEIPNFRLTMFEYLARNTYL